MILDDGEVARAVPRAAGALAEMGFREGDRIAVQLPNGTDWVVLREAATVLGLTFVPLNPRLTGAEVEYALTASGARLVDVAEVKGRAVAARPTRAREPGEIGATLLFTSGTTGRPKGCVRPAVAEAARASELVISYGLSPEDVHLVACPLSHSAPGIFLRAARWVGARTVLMEKFDAAAFVELVRRHEATFFFLVPTQVERLLALPRPSLPSVRAAIVAGAPFREETKRRFTGWLGEERLWEFYGSTETGTIAVLGPWEQPSPDGCVGRPPPGTELRLEGGEVTVRSRALMQGYLGEPPLEPGAFFATGDLGRLDDAGRLVLTGRRRRVIITGGVNVDPVEVEEALRAHPSVVAAAVYGQPDPEWGEVVAARVAWREGELDEEALRTFLRGRLAPYKIPKQWGRATTLKDQ